MPLEHLHRRDVNEQARETARELGTYVVLLLLEPVEWLLSSVRAVSWCSVRLAIVGVSATATGKLGLRERDVRRRVRHLALESIHVVWRKRLSAESEWRRTPGHTLFPAAVVRVDPEPSAVASVLRARRHPRGNLKIREPSPYAGLVDAEDSEVLRLDLRHVRFVRDGQRAALEVVEVHRMHRPAGEAAIGRRAWVVTLAHVATRGRCEV